MPRSLFFRLLGAFVLVILVLAAIATVLANRVTAGQFRVYTNQNGQLWAQRLAPTLANYYARTGSWQGVASALQASSGGMDMMGGWMSGGSLGSGSMGESMMDGGMTQGGTGMYGRRQPSAVGTPVAPAATVQPSWSMWNMMGQRLLLADARGSVVADSQGELAGKALSAQELAEGQPVQVGGQRAGTIIVAASVTSPESPAAEFLSSVNRSIFLAVLAAGAIALALGGLLFFQITAPVRDLKAAAYAIAGGDLQRRVTVRSRDELGDLAQTFNLMAESLSRSETERRQMIADVAHELRTPISVMQANLEAMQDGVLPVDDEQIASLHEETELLARLVADLRLLSLAEAGQLKLERTEVDPVELVRKATERLRPKAEEKGVQLAVQPPASPLPAVLADTDRIGQVIGNLVSNALRYTPTGGTVTVEANVAKPDRRGPEMVLMTVTDTGTGIPAAELPYIFDRFYRADKSRTRASGGSGLGLAIVRYLVEAHGGRAWAESPIFQNGSERSYGTRVSFTLPAAQTLLPSATT
jgi:signal transduction histidine kinase